jgi:membrane-bound ClpP family serine protease
VRVSIQGRLKEYHAVTENDALERNSAVKVLDVSGSQLVVAALKLTGDTD